MNEKIKPEHFNGLPTSMGDSTSYHGSAHREGQQRQYDLAQRARQLGFSQVIVLDEDLGRSGSGLQERPGFGRLLAAVCQGLAGAVLALEASRLARNNRDWHHLVDLCALTGTLLIDDEGTYDPKVLNDRLLLGLKGTMSEFELGLMRQRARQAYLQKVKRGEAMWEVPVGFVRSKEGQIEKTSGSASAAGHRRGLEKFRQLRSARQTLIWLREEQLLLPHADRARPARRLLAAAHVESSPPNPAQPVLRGSLRLRPHRHQDDRLRRSGSHRAVGSKMPQAQWEVLIIDHHAGYIGWSEYLENRQAMAKNLAQREREESGAIKKGAALLSGLLRCGRCGRSCRLATADVAGQVGRYGC